METKLFLIHSLLQFDFAIFELLPNEPDLFPIPICPLIAFLPRDLGCIYGAIGDFQVGEFDEFAIWRAGHHAVLQYHQLNGCKVLSDHGKFRRGYGHEWACRSSPSCFFKSRKTCLQTPQKFISPDAEGS